MGMLDNAEYKDLTWSDFIGNEKQVRSIRIAAASAASREVRLPNLIIEGPSGSGKSMLAVLIAKQMGREVKVASGPIKPLEARVLFSTLEDGDILFIDEAQSLVTGGKSKVDWFLNYLSEGTLITAAGEEEVPQVTVILATNEASKLPDTLTSRFDLRVLLDEYSQEEASQIAKTMAPRVFGTMPIPNDEVFGRIAFAANFNPRLIKKLLGNLRDCAIVSNEIPENGAYDLAEALDVQDYTYDGLNRTAREYMLLMMKFPSGLGATNVAEMLDCPGGVAATERLLLRRGYIIKLRTGRMLSGTGLRRAAQLKAQLEVIPADSGHDWIA